MGRFSGSGAILRAREALGESFAAVLAGYALGSVSFALLVARWRVVDLRGVGSGNPGATNAGRAMGRLWGTLVYLGDALKGFLPVGVALHLGWPTATAALAGAGAFLGHLWPLYHHFRGGKGVATLSGAMLALDPRATLLALGVLVLLVLLTRYMALASMAFGFALPGAVVLLDPAALAERLPVFLLAVTAGPFLLWTHRSNLKRLRAGTEHKLGVGSGRRES